MRLIKWILTAWLIVTILLLSLLYVGEVAVAHAAVTFTGPPALIAEAKAWQTAAAPYVWLGNETVNLTSNPGGCAAPACSAPGTTYLGPTAVAFDFYYEMGHQLDWTYLTGADREYLADQWHTTAPWADDPAYFAQAQETGLEGVFPDFVAGCALGEGAQRERTLQVFADGPSVTVRRFQICGWLNALGTGE